MLRLDATAGDDRAEAISGRLAMPVLAGGVAGLAVWEAFARLVAPAWIGFPLDPTGLIEMAL